MQKLAKKVKKMLSDVDYGEEKVDNTRGDIVVGK